MPIAGSTPTDRRYAVIVSDNELRMLRTAVEGLTVAAGFEPIRKALLQTLEGHLKHGGIGKDLV